MADRDVYVEADGGIGLTPALGESSEPILRVKVDVDNIAAGDAGTENLLLMSVDGVLKKVDASGVRAAAYEKTLVAQFAGAVQAAYDAEDPELTLVRRLPGVAGRTNVVTGGTITGAGGLLGVSGMTQFTFANIHPLTAAGMSPTELTEAGYAEATVSVAADATYSERVGAEIAMREEDLALYVWPITPGGHSDVSLAFDCKVS